MIQSTPIQRIYYMLQPVGIHQNQIIKFGKIFRKANQPKWFDYQELPADILVKLKASEITENTKGHQLTNMIEVTSRSKADSPKTVWALTLLLRVKAFENKPYTSLVT